MFSIQYNTNSETTACDVYVLKIKLTLMYTLLLAFALADDGSRRLDGNEKKVYTQRYIILYDAVYVLI